jgi:hypothetical protein
LDSVGALKITSPARNQLARSGIPKDGLPKRESSAGKGRNAVNKAVIRAD